MANLIPISTLFHPEPHRWGLRGDPHLWREIRDRLSDVPCPATPDELEAIIASQFQALTGHPVSHEGHIHLEKYSHGGMSSGMIATGWWRERAIPLLRQRLQDAETNEAARNLP